MRYAIVDIGSNTMRLNVYEVSADEIHQLFSKKTVAGLSSYIEDGKLNQKGMEKAAKVLRSYKQIADLLQTQKFIPFATASLRNIDNREEALSYILDKAGAKVELVEGTKEALYGYRGLTIKHDVQTGVLFDIGGGSTEMIYFEDGEVKQAESISLGSLNSFTTMTTGLFPTEKEAKHIQNAFRKGMDKIGIPENVVRTTLFGIGGTVRAAGNVCQEYFGWSGNKEIPARALDKLIRDLREQKPRAVRTLLQVVPERIHTLTPGMLIMDALMTRFSADCVIVNKYGVREGFIVDHLLEEGVLKDGFTVD